jgi:hypothetical protein
MTLVIVSHSHLDKDEARNAALLLVMDEVGVWFDEWQIPLGGSIVGSIDEALANSSHMLLMWSKSSSKSPWVTEERHAALSLAIQTGSPRIIVVRLDDTPLPPLLSDRLSMTWMGGTEADRVQLLDAICDRSPTVAFVRAVVRKYNELIYPEALFGSGDPLPYGACPRCGNVELARSSEAAPRSDKLFFFVECPECGWGDWVG